jgi:aryl-alcohol dehydrogenase (NADP+)
MFAWQFAKSLWVADKNGLEPFRTMQNHYNLVYREEEREMIPLCKDQGIGIIPWSPLARGFLSGRYSRSEEPDSPRVRSDPNLKRRYFHPADFDVVEAVVELAKEKDVSPTQIALAWMFSKEYITSPILGVTKVEHVEQAVEALEIKLSIDDIKKIEEPYLPHRIIGHA